MAPHRPATLLLLRAGPGRSRRERRRLRRSQDRGVARAPQPMALHDGDRRAPRRRARGVRGEAPRRDPSRRTPGRAARGRVVRPHRQSLAGAFLRLPDAKKGPGCPGPSSRLRKRSYFFFVVRLRVVRRTARFAGAFFAALRRFLGRSLLLGRLALGRSLALLGRLALDGLLGRLALAGVFLAALRLAGALLFAVRFFAAFRFAGAFFAALRLAGAFLAALLFVAFLAGGTVTTFPESSHSGKFELHR